MSGSIPRGRLPRASFSFLRSSRFTALSFCFCCLARSLLRLSAPCLPIVSVPVTASTVPATTTAAVAAAAAAAAVAAAAVAAAAAARRPLLRFVELELTPVEHGPVELRDRRRRSMGVRHGHEGEAARLPCLAIGGDGNLANLAGCGESALEGCLCSTERKISNVETVSHGCL